MGDRWSLQVSSSVNSGPSDGSDDSNYEFEQRKIRKKKRNIQFEYAQEARVSLLMEEYGAIAEQKKNRCKHSV